MRRQSTRRLVTIAIIAASIVVVILVALIGLGVLVQPASQTSPVTITSVHLEIDQGTSSSGLPWLGPSSINYTSAEGYPVHVSPGKTWTVVWTFANLDSVFHNVSQVSPNSPFTKPATDPSLPYAVGPGEEGALSIILTAPSTPGATYAVTLNVSVAGAIS